MSKKNKKTTKNNIKNTTNSQSSFAYYSKKDNSKQIVGEIFEDKNGKLIFKSNTGRIIHIPQTDNNRRICGAQQKCIVSIANESADSAYGNISLVLGNSGDPIVEGKSIAVQYGFDEGFSESALKQADEVSKTEITASGRVDYRNTNFCTIDPTNSKDFDDGFIVERHNDGTFTLRVAIADVSKYVKPNTPLFNEAITKANSKYLGETVYPMLPEILSNGVCSLNEGVDRYTLNTTINFTPKGKIDNYEIGLGVINSKKRFTYKQVADMHEGKGENIVDNIKFGGMIEDAYKLSDILRNRRINRGAFDIGSREPAFILDETRTKVKDIVLDHTESSTFIIESFMLACNEVWADFADRAKIPYLYRNHLPMSFDSIKELKAKLSELDVFLPDNPSTVDLQNIINSHKNTNLSEPITAMILKAMPHASYGVSNYGHVGLGINADTLQPEDRLKETGEKFVTNSRDAYFKEHGTHTGFKCKFYGSVVNGTSHTTSPIRRGADLLDHTQITSLIETGEPYFSQTELSKYASNLNEIEVISDKAESKYKGLLSAIWAKDHLGENIDGVIVENEKGKLTVLNPSNCLKVKVPQSETTLKQTKNGKSKNDANYSLGNEITVQIYDAITNPSGLILASENLNKHNEDKHSKANYDLSCDDKFVM